MTVGERRFLVRGVAAGAGAMLVGVVFALMFVLAFSGDPGPGWADRHTVTGVLLTALWCAAAGGAGAASSRSGDRVSRMRLSVMTNLPWWRRRGGDSLGVIRRGGGYACLLTGANRGRGASSPAKAGVQSPFVIPANARIQLPSDRRE
jgi:hypothetical protein